MLSLFNVLTTRPGIAEGRGSWGLPEAVGRIGGMGFSAQG